MSDRLSGLHVKCPNCRQVYFRTTEKYDPDAPANGAMVVPTVKYHLDWLQISATQAAEMCCPECLAPLAPKGKLWVIMAPGPAMESPGIPGPVSPAELTTPFTSDGNPPVEFPCPTCGKVCKSQLGLNSHMRSHS